MAQRALAIDPTSLLLTYILYHTFGTLSIGLVKKVKKILHKKAGGKSCGFVQNAQNGSRQALASRRGKRGRCRPPC